MAKEGIKEVNDDKYLNPTMKKKVTVTKNLVLPTATCPPRERG